MTNGDNQRGSIEINRGRTREAISGKKTGI